MLRDWIRKVLLGEVGPVIEAEAAVVGERFAMAGLARGIGNAVEAITGRRPELPAPVELPAIEPPAEKPKRGRMTAITLPIPTLNQLRDQGEVPWLVPVEPQPTFCAKPQWCPGVGQWTHGDEGVDGCYVGEEEYPEEGSMFYVEPHVSGDVLAVREEWRVWSWMNGEPIVLEFRDGILHVDDCDEHEDWCVFMQTQSGDDCEKAGWILDTTTDLYLPPDGNHDVEPPTRWRVADTLPEFACRTMAKVAEVRTPVRIGNTCCHTARAAGFDGEDDCFGSVAFANLVKWWKREHPTLPLDTWVWPVLLKLERKTDGILDSQTDH